MRKKERFCPLCVAHTSLGAIYIRLGSHMKKQLQKAMTNSKKQ